MRYGSLHGNALGLNVVCNFTLSIAIESGVISPFQMRKYINNKFLKIFLGCIS